jgi:hypothetical protein
MRCRFCYSEAMAASSLKRALPALSPKKALKPKHGFVAQQDRFLIKLTHGTYENPWQYVPFARRFPSGTPAATCSTYAETSGPRAETSVTVTEAYGKPSGTSRPIRHGVKRHRPAKQTPSTSALIPPSGIRISSSPLTTKSPPACCPPPPGAGYSRSCSS